MNDTIVAISTPIGEGGIGIVRLSGKDALKIADKIFVSKDNKKPSDFKTYTVHYGCILEKNNSKHSHNNGPTGQTGQRANGHRIIDEVILTVMRAPKSYTREDVVEINCHSGIVPLKKILDLVLVNGARLAEPGEFTKRAFLNGRIDISQAEAVLDIIRAKTDLSLRSAIGNLEGLFSKKIRDIRNLLMDIFVTLEALIDFSEEEDVGSSRKKDILKNLQQVKKAIEKLISTADEGRILRQGIKTVICGKANVGKSSLMNAILKDSRVIVTHIPGTTRDTVEETVNIKGVPLVLVDTAGIKKARHIIDKEGIRRSHISIESADLILLVLDCSTKLDKNDFDIMNKIKARELIIVMNKNDLKKRIDLKAVRKSFPKKPIVYVSALNLTGIDKLENKISDVVFKGKAPSADLIGVSNARQLDALRRALQEVGDAIDSYKNNAPADCIAVYVKSGIEKLGEITGESVTEEALDRIFSEFCVGK